MPEDELEAYAAQRTSGVVERHRTPCVSRASDTCVYLRDGTKVVLERGHGATGPVRLMVQRQAIVRPASAAGASTAARAHIAGWVGRFDAFEFNGVRPANEDRDVEPCADAEAKFFAVYGHVPSGGVEWIADCGTRDDAEMLCAVLTTVRIVLVSFGVEIES